jgi:gamma-glutamyl:cysteine ligase YbdK (ATP-grasp superfamily)
VFREQVVFGCHVHVGIEDREAAIQTMNRVRPSSHFETLEFRVADSVMRVDEAVLVAALARALAFTGHAAALRGDPDPRPRPELLRAAKWRAARHGLDGELAGGTARPASARPSGAPAAWRTWST